MQISYRRENSYVYTKNPSRNIDGTYKKSSVKYSFFSCCKTDDVIMGARIIAPGRRDDNPVVKCVPKLVPAGDLASEKARYGGGQRPKTNLKRVLKAVLFERSLAKKINNKKQIQKLQNLNTKLATKLEKDHKISDGKEIVKKVVIKHLTTKNSQVHSLKSWNTSSVMGYHPRTYSCNNGLCLILLSLFVMVIWGKVCAIICTSTWLFFVPRKGCSNKSFIGFMENSKKVNSEEHKKKMIMEGMLEKNRIAARSSGNKKYNNV